EDVQVEYTRNVFSGSHTVPVQGLNVRSRSGELVSEEPWKVPSAYGRYYRCAFGKEITNRPEDNRFRNADGKADVRRVIG
ncbi:MAG: hypothetical protein J5794_02680, partial [Lachnospiraceae bacterium]|nr:hypothetical protein [Lachnospiraceae bacterium]